MRGGGGRLLAMLVALALAGCDCGGTNTPDGGDAGGGGGAGGGGAGGGAGGGGTGGGGTGGGAGGGDAGQALTAAEFCVALATARCARDSACGFLDAPQAATCRAWLEAECLRQVSRADAGLGVFDELAARGCLAAVPAARCIEGPLTVPSPCDFHAVYRPAGLPGTNCLDSQDCVGGFCFGGLRECNSCRSWVAVDQPCSLNDRQCNPAAAYCATPGDGGAPVCRPRLADGTPCAADRECASSYCNWLGSVSDAGPDTCGHLPIGAPCGGPSDCMGEAYCQGYYFDGTTVTPGSCRARLAVGVACANHPEDDGCVPPSTCLEGRCTLVAPYSLDAGAECEGLSHCAETYFCRGFEELQADGGASMRSGVCAARLGAGVGCSYTTYVDSDCAADLTCGNGGECVARSPSGGACAAGYECRDFLTCGAGTGQCRPLPGTGDPCDPSMQCAAGLTRGRCVYDAGSFTCEPPLQVGAACSALQPADCASGRCFATDGGATPICQASCLP